MAALSNLDDKTAPTHMSGAVRARRMLYSFDPYEQARPDVYKFYTDQSPDPGVKMQLMRFDQLRIDEEPMGTLEAAPTGEPRTLILRIEWRKNTRSDYTWRMIGSIGGGKYGVVLQGYVKRVHYKFSVKFVAVVKRMHGKPVWVDQFKNMLSLPMYDAFATGVAFGMYSQDAKIAAKYPDLGTALPFPTGDDAIAYDLTGILGSTRRALHDTGNFGASASPMTLHSPYDLTDASDRKGLRVSIGTHPETGEEQEALGLVHDLMFECETQCHIRDMLIEQTQDAVGEKLATHSVMLFEYATDSAPVAHFVVCNGQYAGIPNTRWGVPETEPAAVTEEHELEAALDDDLQSEIVAGIRKLSATALGC